MLLTIKQNAPLFITSRSDANKAGGYRDTHKRMGRKEFAETHGFDQKADGFDETYQDYLKKLHVQQTVVVELMHQNGIPVASTSVRKDKAGNVIGGSMNWSKAKAPKANANQTRLLELEATNKKQAEDYAKLMAEMAEIRKSLPAPKVEAPAAPAPAAKK